MVNLYMKLISLNIEADRHFELVMPFLARENADVVCLQEVMETQVPMFERQLQMAGKFSPLVNIDPTVPFEVGDPGGVGGLGNVVLVRREAEKESGGISAVRFDCQYYVGSADQVPTFTRPEVMSRALVWAKFSLPNAAGTPIDYSVATTHFTWSPMGRFTSQQEQEFAALMTILDQFESLILCGDFNSPRKPGVDNVFSRLAKRYRDWIPPQATSTLDHQLHKAGPLDLVVDGLFTTPDYVCQNVQIIDGVSDHRAIVAQIEPSSSAI